MNFIGVGLAISAMSFMSVHPFAIMVVGVFGFIVAAAGSEK